MNKWLGKRRRELETGVESGDMREREREKERGREKEERKASWNGGGGE